MKYSNEQTLEIMKEFFVHCYKEYSKTKNSANIEIAASECRDRTFPFMVELCELSEFPSVVSDKSFDETQSIKFYRGVTDLKYTANLLCDFDYHYGKGSVADGIYASSIKVVAETYAMNSVKYGHILSLKLDPSTKFCSVIQMTNLMYKLEGFYKEPSSKNKFISESLENFKSEKNYSEIEQRIKSLFNFIEDIKNQQEKEILIRNLTKGLGKLAIYLGFDAMNIDDNFANCTIFNRGKIIVSKSEFNKVVASSNDYNSDGTIKRLSGDSEGEEGGEKIPQKQ